MKKSLLKPVVLFAFMSLLFLKANAQTPDVQNDALYAFNFKSASANIRSSEISITKNYTVAAAASGQKKMTHEKKMKIAGAVLTSVGVAALAGTITGAVIYGRQIYGRNRIYNSDDLGPTLRFYGILAGGTIVSNTLIGVGAWMIADN